MGAVHGLSRVMLVLLTLLSFMRSGYTDLMLN